MMKKSIFIFILFLFPILLLAQPSNGNGTSGNPYSGTLTSDFSFSGNIYIGADLNVSNGKLTINAGTNVIFVSPSANLVFSDYGQLSALGTPNNKITFTADFSPFNGIFGETGEQWGHISFECISFADSSLMKNCIVEYGSKTGTGVDSHGGGINILFSKVRLSDCIVRNNLAAWGGGIFIDRYMDPLISRCHIYSNTSQAAGGGIYLWNGSNAIVNNCIIDLNNCISSLYNFGGGGVFIQSTNYAKIQNCTIVNNTSVGNRGVNIYFYGTSLASLINTIIWSDENSVFFDGTNQPFNLVNCAIQRIYNSGGTIPATSFTNCVDLGSSNNAVDGPNFTNPGGGDYSIAFISPCRDTGTSTGAPLTDFLGNGRIGPYDIGAFEVQYSRWTGATDNTWINNTNWEQSVDPTHGTGDVIIPAGLSRYPTGGLIKSFIIGSGKTMIINPGAQTTLTALTNNGTLKLESDGTGIASLKIDGYFGSGTTEIQLYLEGNTNGTMWHYISPPVVSIPATLLSSAGAGVAAYEENLINNDMNNGWVTSTGYHYDTTIPTPAWVNTGQSWPNLLAGSGYNYYASSPKTFTIQGPINTRDISVNLAYNSGNFGTLNPAQQGYNLIGNPFTCGLEWDAVIAANSGIWTDVESTIYFRVNGVTIYYGGGFTVPNTYNADASLVPPMQGFFIKSNLNNVTLNLPASAKAHTTNKRYKGNSSSPNIRLQFENAANSDQTVISFNEKATLSFDNLFDARKLFTADTDPYIYSAINGNNYAINGIPFPENSVTIPLVVNANTNGSYTIKAVELTGLDNYKIYLNDKLQNTQVNLSDVSSYSFNATAGKITDRFTITVTNVLTAIPENTVNNSNKPFNIYSSGEQINIQTLSDDWNGMKCEIRVHDLTGKVISQITNTEFSKDEIKHLPANASKGIYIVEIKSAVKRYVGKVVIR
jgi:hypothetical protein